MRHYLPPELVAALELASLRLEKDTFVDTKLRQHFSDLLFEVRLVGGGAGYVLLLFEHKSQPDEWVALQLLRYLAQSWESLRQRGLASLPLIVPVVLYHGPGPWRISTHFKALLAMAGLPAALLRYALDFEYYLCDLTRYRDKDLAGGAGLQPALQLMKHIRQKDVKQQLPGIFNTLAEQLPAGAVRERLETMVRYVMEARRATETDVRDALDKAGQGGIEMESVLERIFSDYVEKGLQKGLQKGLEQGLEQGLQQGLQQGQQIGIAAQTLRFLRAQLGPLDAKVEARIRALSQTQLERLGDALPGFRSPADLTAWLRRHAPQKTRKQK